MFYCSRQNPDRAICPVLSRIYDVLKGSFVLIYDFDRIIDRRGTQSSKWDNAGARTGNPQALPMWVADTDFEVPLPVREAVMQRAIHPVYGYAFVEPRFQTVTAQWLKRQHGWSICPEWSVFASGVNPAVCALIQAFTEPGDNVIVQTPLYHSFLAAVTNNGRHPSENRLIYKEGRYTMDFDDLDARAKSAKLMILCSPHNPVGRIWTREELQAVGEICLRHGVILISDEIHSDLVLFGSRHLPTLSLDKRFEEFTVSCYAPSKTFNLAGLKASAIVVPNPGIRKKLESQFQKNRSSQQNIFALPALIAAYTQCDDYLLQLKTYLEGNVRLIDRFLKENMPMIKLVWPQATYLAWLDCSDTGLEGDALGDFFINKCGVAINRGDTFGSGGERFARLNFGCPKRTLEAGLLRIYNGYRRWL